VNPQYLPRSRKEGFHKDQDYRDELFATTNSCTDSISEKELALAEELMYVKRGMNLFLKSEGVN